MPSDENSPLANLAAKEEEIFQHLDQSKGDLTMNDDNEHNEEHVDPVREAQEQCAENVTEARAEQNEQLHQQAIESGASDDPAAEEEKAAKLREEQGDLPNQHASGQFAAPPSVAGQHQMEGVDESMAAKPADEKPPTSSMVPPRPFPSAAPTLHGHATIENDQGSQKFNVSQSEHHLVPKSAPLQSSIVNDESIRGRLINDVTSYSDSLFGALDHLAGMAERSMGEEVRAARESITQQLEKLKETLRTKKL